MVGYLQISDRYSAMLIPARVSYHECVIIAHNNEKLIRLKKHSILNNDIIKTLMYLEGQFNVLKLLLTMN